MIGPNTVSAVIEPLGRHHDRAAFSCGNIALDTYIKTQAAQDGRRNIARTFVLVGDKADEIAGYYTLSTAEIHLGELPEDLSRKLPRYPEIPAALIGRLAVAFGYQGKKWGGVLLVDAIKRIIEAGGDMAAYAVVVHAKDDAAVSFYEHFGFRRFPSLPRNLFLPVNSAKQLFP